MPANGPTCSSAPGVLTTPVAVPRVSATVPATLPDSCSLNEVTEAERKVSTDWVVSLPFRPETSRPEHKS